MYVIFQAQLFPYKMENIALTRWLPALARRPFNFIKGFSDENYDWFR